MYPGLDLLQEVGRVSIAGARLDLQMGMLWHSLDRRIDLERARRVPGHQQRDKVLRLAHERLRGELLGGTLAAVNAANAARARRNEIIHQDWVLRGRDALRPVAELTDIAPQDLPAYFEEWDREAKASPEWQRVPSRSVEVVAAQTLDELRQVERELAAATELVTQLTFAVASSRETGKPPATSILPTGGSRRGGGGVKEPDG